MMTSFLAVQTIAKVWTGLALVFLFFPGERQGNLPTDNSLSADNSIPTSTSVQIETPQQTSPIVRRELREIQREQQSQEVISYLAEPDVVQDTVSTWGSAYTFDPTLSATTENTITIGGEKIRRMVSILSAEDFNVALRETADVSLRSQTLPYLEAAQNAQRLSDESIFSSRDPAWGYNTQVGELIRRTNNFERLLEALEILLVKHRMKGLSEESQIKIGHCMDFFHLIEDDKTGDFDNLLNLGEVGKARFFGMVRDHNLFNDPKYGSIDDEDTPFFIAKLYLSEFVDIISEQTQLSRNGLYLQSGAIIQCIRSDYFFLVDTPEKMDALLREFYRGSTSAYWEDWSEDQNAGGDLTMLDASDQPDGDASDQSDGDASDQSDGDANDQPDEKGS